MTKDSQPDNKKARKEKAKGQTPITRENQNHTRNTKKQSSEPNDVQEGINMAKAGMKRPDPKEPHGTESNHKQRFPKNEEPPVPEIKGKAKYGHKKANV